MYEPQKSWYTEDVEETSFEYSDHSCDRLAYNIAEHENIVKGIPEPSKTPRVMCRKVGFSEVKKVE